MLVKPAFNFDKKSEWCFHIVLKTEQCPSVILQWCVQASRTWIKQDAKSRTTVNSFWSKWSEVSILFFLGGVGWWGGVKRSGGKKKKKKRKPKNKQQSHAVPFLIHVIVFSGICSTLEEWGWIKKLFFSQCSSHVCLIVMALLCQSLSKT